MLIFRSFYLGPSALPRGADAESIAGFTHRSLVSGCAAAAAGGAAGSSSGGGDGGSSTALATPTVTTV